jgi:hypothetical protein
MTRREGSITQRSKGSWQYDTTAHPTPAESRSVLQKPCGATNLLLRSCSGNAYQPLRMAVM